MFKKIAATALITAAAATALVAPASAAAPVTVQGFTLLKERTGYGRALRLWLNTANNQVHANLSGARYGDRLSIGSCCYPYTTYETVTSNGQSELNTGEYGNYGPSVNGVFADGGELHF
ncbi:hypothetical protein [Amycolatopsis sp. Hca4]|uniref:hypothetical protein n=1 Tax=Amycolatopsis sp. Hca4 TaxID=2742131 RepID=UPI001592409E|nr:hypothetical protein [Amycolatopsis sp. Hca4]QKV76651.1 hypothetical protein HUT10_24910 [Amycolatopsis sp. Hca4]